MSFLSNPFPDMVKFVVDVEQGVMALGGEMHTDAEEVLLENGSAQASLWGGNAYPRRPANKLEYSSLINIRPSQDNRSLEVEDAATRKRMEEIVRSFLPL